MKHYPPRRHRLATIPSEPHFVPRRSVIACLVALALAVVIGMSNLAAQQLRSGGSVNIVAGVASVKLDPATNKILKIVGDPYLQRQNEPSVACSTFNPEMCLAAANDTRLVKAPGLPKQLVTGDSWLGIFWTHNGGQSWTSTMLPGFPQDGSAAGMSSPLYGKEAAADPTVRAGSDGWFYVSGIAFNREGGLLNGQAKKGVSFVAVYKDPGKPGAPPVYHGTYVTDTGGSGQFMDKPWIAVDIPRGSATCGRVYFAETVFTGSGTNNQSKVLVNSSSDCGKTWNSTPSKVSESFQVNQSANLTIDPNTGDVYVTWRVFGTSNQSAPSQILFSKSPAGGTRWSKPTVIRSLGLWGSTTSLAPDQGSLPTDESPLYRMFRTNMYPSMCVTTDGVIRIAFSERKNGDPEADSRVQVAAFDGTSWTVSPIDDHAGRGNQLMPSIACSGTRAIVLWYDQRNDSAPRAFPHLPLFGPLVFDLIPPPPTHTLDVRAAQTGSTGAFGASIQVSRYRVGRFNDIPMQLEYNAVNWPLFGQLPFMGDYIDVESDKKMMPFTKLDGSTGWRFFGAPPPSTPLDAVAVGKQVAAEKKESPVFHAVWADNRDVIPSFLSPYTPLDPNAGGTEPADAWLKLDDAGNAVAENWQAPGGQCTPGAPTANKNQNVYSTILSDGLIVGTLDESSTANGLRGYAMFIANTSSVVRIFKATTDHGSFAYNSALSSVVLTIPPNNTRAATVFLSGPVIPRTTVTVQEQAANGTPLALNRSIVVNPAPAASTSEKHNVDLSVLVNQITTIENPIFDPTNPIFDPTNPIFDPTNPIFDPTNPIFDPTNPIFDPTNPIFDPTNPIFDPTNPIFDPTNPIFDPTNPIFDPTNPIFDPTNPIFDPTNPIFDPTNKALDDGEPTAFDQTKVTQISATVTNTGNVATSYDLSTIFASLPTDVIWQLVIAKVSAMPATANQCNLLYDPRFQTSTNVGTTESQATSSLILNRDQTAVVLLRIYHSETVPFITKDNAQHMLTMTVSSQAPNGDETIPRSDTFGNTAPTAVGQSVTTDEDTEAVITLQATDAEGDVLTYSIVDGPSHGSLSGTGSEVTYTPSANYSGADSFTFRANDGGVFSTPATVSITVTPVNDAPVATDGAATTAEDVEVVLTLAGTDVESNPLAYAIVAGPSHGTLSGSLPTPTYTPNANYNGADSFTFKVNDGVADSNVATVAITITPVNDAPVASPQSVATPEDTAVGIVLGGTDAEGTALTFSVTAPSHGLLSGTLPNITYTPNADFAGVDSFSFTVSDGAATSAPAAVSITVSPVNDRPVANNDTAGPATIGALLTINVLGNDTDIDDPVTNLTVAAITQSPLYGTAQISADGKSIIYTPSAAFAGIDTLAYTARDAAGAVSNAATVSVSTTVRNVDRLLAPYQAPPKKTYNLGQSIPLVWQFRDATGAAIDSLWLQPMLYVTFTKLQGTNASCTGLSESTTVVINEDFPGNSSFQYFGADKPHQTAGAYTWQFNWQTVSPVTSGCWNGRIILDLNGNSLPGDAGDQISTPFPFLIKP